MVGEIKIPEYKNQGDYKRYGYCPNCERVQPITKHGMCQVCDSKFINPKMGEAKIEMKDDKS